jgi:uncharacterized protein (DUF488 family)
MTTDLSSDFRQGSGVTVWTVGHSHHPLELFLARLREHDIELVVDVRSRPYARHAPHFDRPELEHSLARAGISYQWLGDKLGQRPEGERFYDADGHTLYDELLKEQWFMKAIGLLEHEAETRRIALVCLEEEPERCHRWALIGRLLADRGASVRHIRADRRVQSQQEVDYLAGAAQESLFGEEPVWRSPEPMRDMRSRRGPGAAGKRDDPVDAPFEP